MIQSLNAFVAARMGEIEARERTRFLTPQETVALTRRNFLKRGGAVVVMSAFFGVLQMAMPNYARAANAVVYVDSTASGANNGTSWANAYTTLAAAIAASGTTGTDFYVYSGHSEALSANAAFKGVAATPDRLFSCDRTNSPPQTGDLLAGASFTTGAGVTMDFRGNVYIYGISGADGAGSSASAFNIGQGSGAITMDTCTLSIATTQSTSYFVVGTSGSSSAGAPVTFINTTVQFANASQCILPVGGSFRWFNTPSAIQGATLPTTLFITNNSSSRASGPLILDGIDLSALSAKTIVGAGGTLPYFQAVDCKLPASITLAATPTGPGCTYDFITTDSTVVNTSSFIQTRIQYPGTLTADNTVYNGATDGVNPISWKVVMNGNITNGTTQTPFECFEIVQWAAAGTYAASTVVATSATSGLLTNDLWVEVNYLGTSGNPLAKRATTFGAGSGTVPLPQIPQGTTPSALATGATWGTGGAGTNYTLAVPSFTTTLAGYVRFVVKISKPSITVWIDPNATIA